MAAQRNGLYSKDISTVEDTAAEQQPVKDVMHQVVQPHYVGGTRGNPVKAAELLEKSAKLNPAAASRGPVPTEDDGKPKFGVKDPVTGEIFAAYGATQQTAAANELSQQANIIRLLDEAEAINEANKGRAVPLPGTAQKFQAIINNLAARNNVVVGQGAMAVDEYNRQSKTLGDGAAHWTNTTYEMNTAGLRQLRNIIMGSHAITTGGLEETGAYSRNRANSLDVQPN